MASDLDWIDEYERQSASQKVKGIFDLYEEGFEWRDNKNFEAIFYGNTERDLPHGYGVNFAYHEYECIISLGNFEEGFLVKGQLLWNSGPVTKCVEGFFKNGRLI